MDVSQFHGASGYYGNVGDIDDIASEIGATVAPTVDTINEFMNNGAIQLADLRERRRALEEQQRKLSEVHARVVSAVAPKPKLHEFIMSLRDKPHDTIEYELYEYVTKLRYLKYGIWCAQCESAKRIGGRDQGAIARDVDAEARGEDPEHHAVARVIPEDECADDSFHAFVPRPAAIAGAPVVTPMPAIAPVSALASAAVHTSAPVHTSAHTYDHASVKSRIAAAIIDSGAYPEMEEHVDTLAEHVVDVHTLTNLHADANEDMGTRPTCVQQLLDNGTITCDDIAGIGPRIAALRELRDGIQSQLDRVDAYLSKFATILNVVAPPGAYVPEQASLEIPRAAQDWGPTGDATAPVIVPVTGSSALGSDSASIRDNIDESMAKYATTVDAAFDTSVTMAPRDPFSLDKEVFGNFDAVCRDKIREAAIRQLECPDTTSQLEKYVDGVDASRFADENEPNLTPDQMAQFESAFVMALESNALLDDGF